MHVCPFCKIGLKPAATVCAGCGAREGCADNNKRGLHTKASLISLSIFLFIVMVLGLAFRSFGCLLLSIAHQPHRSPSSLFSKDILMDSELPKPFSQPLSKGPLLSGHHSNEVSMIYLKTHRNNHAGGNA